MFVLLAVVPVLLIIVFIIRSLIKYRNALCESTKRLDGKTAIVTGGTAGMGLEIARDLARRGARVIIACPFPDEGKNAQQTIVEDTGNEQVIFKLLDLASLDSVRKFATHILNTEDRLNILINNAGVGFPKDFVTSDGISFIMQVNYFGHFLLTLLLLPLLKKTGKTSDPSRIVNTSSVLHNITLFHIGDWSSSNHWFEYIKYSKSKLCLILFSRELSKRLEKCNVVVNSIEPGFVGTGIFHTLGLLGTILILIGYNMFKTPWEGAQTALHVALDVEAGKSSGQHYANCKLRQPAPWARNDKTAEQLWEESVRLVKLSDKEHMKCFNLLDVFTY